MRYWMSCQVRCSIRLHIQYGTRSQPAAFWVKTPGELRKTVAVAGSLLPAAVVTIMDRLPGAPRVDVLLNDEEIRIRRQGLEPVELKNDSPWQELYRAYTGQLDTGACLDFAVEYRDLRKVVPRHSH